jgi:hypothetical protein
MRAAARPTAQGSVRKSTRRKPFAKSAAKRGRHALGGETRKHRQRHRGDGDAEKAERKLLEALRVCQPGERFFMPSVKEAKIELSSTATCVPLAASMEGHMRCSTSFTAGSLQPKSKRKRKPTRRSEGS